MRSNARDQRLESIAGAPAISHTGLGSLTMGTSPLAGAPGITQYAVIISRTPAGSNLDLIGEERVAKLQWSFTGPRLVGHAGIKPVGDDGWQSSQWLDGVAPGLYVLSQTVDGTTPNGRHKVFVNGVKVADTGSTPNFDLGGRMGFTATAAALSSTNFSYRRALAYRTVHSDNQRRRIEQWLLREAAQTLEGIVGTPIAQRTTGGTTSNIAGQTGILLDPLTMYCSYWADGTMSTNYPQLMVVSSDGTHRATFQGRPTGSEGFGNRIDTTAAANQSTAIASVGRAEGLHVAAMRFNQGLTTCEYWIDGVPYSNTQTIVPGEGIGRTSLFLSSSYDCVPRRGLFYNEFHTPAQVGQVTAWLRKNSG